MTVDVLGFQWSWQFKYPQYGVTNAGNMWGEGPLPVLEIPTGETVEFNLTSDDVSTRSGFPSSCSSATSFPDHPNHFAGHRDQDRDLYRALQ